MDTERGREREGGKERERERDREWKELEISASWKLAFHYNRPCYKVAVNRVP